MTGRVEAVCVSGADLLPLPGKRPNRSGHRQAAGRPAGSPSTSSVWTATSRSTEAPRRRGAGGLRLRPGGRRLLDRRARPRAARRAGSARTCAPPASTCATPSSASAGGSGRRCSRSPPGAPRAPTSPASGTSPTWSSASPRTAPPAPTCGCWRPARSAPATPSRSSSRPDHGITVEAAFRIAMTQKSRLPELAPALQYLPVKDQPKLAARIDEAAGRADLSRPPRYCPPRFAGSRPARRGGRRVPAREGRRAAGARRARRPGAGRLRRRLASESAPDLLAQRQDHPRRREDAHFVLDSDGRARHRHRR